MDAKHLHDFIIVPALDHIGFNSLAASRLLLGTALAESEARWVRQLSAGPAIGLFQMEPMTHDDIWDNWLAYKPEIARRLHELAGSWPHGATAMTGNVYYAAGMTRCHYLRIPEPLPKPDDPEGLARYHERWYNTRLGAVGRTRDVLERLECFERAIRETNDE